MWRAHSNLPSAILNSELCIVCVPRRDNRVQRKPYRRIDVEAGHRIPAACITSSNAGMQLTLRDRARDRARVAGKGRGQKRETCWDTLQTVLVGGSHSHLQAIGLDMGATMLGKWEAGRRVYASAAALQNGMVWYGMVFVYAGLAAQAQSVEWAQRRTPGVDEY